MDQSRPPLSDPKPFGSDTHSASAVKPGTKQDDVQKKFQSTAGDVATHAADAAGEVVDHAKAAAEQVIDHAKDAAGDALGAIAEDVARQAPDMVRRVRDQATNAANDLYRAGGEHLTRGVATYPLTSVVMAAVVGYGLGYLFSRRY